MNRYIQAAFFLILSISCSSCSTRLFGRKKHKTNDVAAVQPADTAMAVATPIQPATPVEANAAMQLIADLTPMWTKRLDYKTFSGKAKVNFDGPNGSLDLTANFRLKKDSIIWVHITALGGMISAARIYVSRDSFFMLNYQEKEATRIALKDAAKTLPTAVDFDQLQNLIVGEPLRNGAITAAESQATAWLLNIIDTTYTQHITFRKSDSTMTADRMTTLKPGGPKAAIDYSDYEMVDGRRLATGRKIKVENADKVYNIEMNFVNEDFDKELEYPFWVPRNYTIKNPK